MKQYKTGRYIVITVVGAVLFGAGILLLNLLPEVQGQMRAVPYLLIGGGAGIFGGGLGSAIASHHLKKHPKAAKQAEIEQKDERNRLIRDKAKARAYDLMLYVFTAILFTLPLLGAQLHVTLILTGVYLAFVFTNIFFFLKYQKEM